MLSVGNRLKLAREKNGQTITDVAHAIRASSSYVQAIEADDFNRFPAPIYALGFIRLYAEFVGENFASLEKIFRTQIRVTENIEAERPVTSRKSATTPARPAQPPPAPDARTAKARRSWPKPSWPGLCLNVLKKITRGLKDLGCKIKLPRLPAVRLLPATWKKILWGTVAAILVLAVLVLAVLQRQARHDATQNLTIEWLGDPPPPYVE